VSKLQKKRASLLKTAMSFTAQGIEFDPKSLPRSLAVDADGKITEVPQQMPHAV
jgi:hypothetical protein